VAALVLLYFVTVWKNDIAWQKEWAELERKRKENPDENPDPFNPERQEFTPVELQWQQQIAEQQAQELAAAQPESHSAESNEAASNAPESSQSETVKQSSAADEGYISNVEMLMDPDAFRDHFESVMKLPDIPFEDARAACNWESKNGINFQFNDGEGGIGQDTRWTLMPRPQTELDGERRRWQRFMKNDLLPWKDHAHRFSGRGIVIVGGKSFGRIAVILRQLKHLGSEMPVELHYWGDEVDDEKKKQFTDLWPQIFFNDLSGPHNAISTLYDTGFAERPHCKMPIVTILDLR
jgi:alpha 1,2-mannosyltransferase